MNGEFTQQQKKERIASQVIRALAFVGVAALLALLAWVVVVGTRSIPETGSGLRAAVSAIQSFFSPASEESITFELPTRTLASGVPVTVAWQYTGKKGQTYTFSYACVEQTGIEVEASTGWQALACNTPYTTENAFVLMRATLTTGRFADIELSVKGGDVTDTTLVTVTLAGDGSAQSKIASSTTEAAPKTTTTTSGVTTKPATTVVRPSVTVPRNTGPSDLVLNIADTGIMVHSSGKDTFFPISPIPSNKTAAVKFTVTNRGGEDSGAWAFIANLPIEGDSDYRYVSPAQGSLASGMQVEFTLSFDEVLRASTGTIKIEIVPAKESDKESNNEDVVKISIRKK